MGVMIAACSPKLKVADCQFNIQSMLVEIEKADKAGCKVILFPELSITSASCGAVFSSPTLLDAASDALFQLARETAGYDIYMVVGLPREYMKQIYSCAAVIHKGAIKAYIPKIYPDHEDNPLYSFSGYTVSEEDSVFNPGYVFSINGLPFRVVVGSDIQRIFLEDTVILNPSSIPVVAGEYRRYLDYMLSYSARGCSVAAVNPSFYESTSCSVYGGTAVICSGGSLLSERKPFKDTEVYAIIENDFIRRELPEVAASRGSVSTNPFIPADNPAGFLDEILAIQAHALVRRMLHTNSQRLVVGISGGLDSTLTLLACVSAAGILKRDPRDTVTAVSMPAFGSSNRTRNNAQLLCEGLGVDFRVINISEAVGRHLLDIGHDGKTPDLTYENAQARERTQILLDICNMTGGIMIGTGDLSELVLGFATYGGDLLSMYGINASLPKTLVRALVLHYGDKTGGILKSILYDIADTPISPELLPPEQGTISQKTEDIIGPYELHDFFIYQMFECRQRPAGIYAAACEAFGGVFTPERILHWMSVFFQRFFSSAFKRISLPESPKIIKTDIGSFVLPGDISGIEWIKETQSLK